MTEKDLAGLGGEWRMRDGGVEAGREDGMGTVMEKH